MIICDGFKISNFRQKIKRNDIENITGVFFCIWAFYSIAFYYMSDQSDNQSFYWNFSTIPILEGKFYLYG